MTTHDTALAQAQSARAALEKTRNNRWYPMIHAAAPAGWINDPNGLSYFNGEYHLFYQHHPYSTHWGPMHWGHLVSKDLIHWEHRAIALAPSEKEDLGGVWSGSAVIDPEGRLCLFYTGNRWRNGVDDTQGKIQTQCCAVSTDAHTFNKLGAVIEEPDYEDIRDPKVFTVGQTWYMVLGARSKNNRGQVLLYSSADLSHWTFERVLFEDPNPEVYMIECPDMFELDGHWVIAYGPMTHARPHGFSGRNGHNAGYIVGDWEPGSAFCPLTPYRQNDWGHNFYACQSFLDPKGRRIVIGWMGGFTLPLASQAHDGWSGQMSLPRQLHLDSELRLVSTPIEEIESLREDSVEWGPLKLNADEEKTLLDEVDAAEIELDIDLDASDAERVSLLVHRTSASEFTEVAYDDLMERIILDRGLHRPSDRGMRAAPAPNAGILHLRVIIDRASVEVFIGDGHDVLSSLSFPGQGPRSIALTSVSGTAYVPTLKTHRLASIW